MENVIREDAKIYAVIQDMERAELGAVILGAGFALPEVKTRENLQSIVRQRYQNGTVSAEDILMEYGGGL